MKERIDVECAEMVNRKGIPLRSWDSVKKNYAQAAGTNKAKALLRRLDREHASE